MQIEYLLTRPSYFQLFYRLTCTSSFFYVAFVTLSQALCIASEVKLREVTSEITRPRSYLSPDVLCLKRAQERTIHKKA